MAKDKDTRDAWGEAQAEALYADFRAKEAAQAEAEAEKQTPTVIEGDHHGMTGGTRHGGQHFRF
jgi:hypothetical protein